MDTGPPGQGNGAQPVWREKLGVEGAFLELLEALLKRCSGCGVNTPYETGTGMLFYSHEYIGHFNYSSSVVWWGWILLWRTCHRRQRDWPDSVDLPRHLFHGWIPREDVMEYSAITTLMGSRV